MRSSVRASSVDKHSLATASTSRSPRILSASTPTRAYVALTTQAARPAVCVRLKFRDGRSRGWTMRGFPRSSLAKRHSAGRTGA